VAATIGHPEGYEQTIAQAAATVGWTRSRWAHERRQGARGSKLDRQKPSARAPWALEPFRRLLNDVRALPTPPSSPKPLWTTPATRNGIVQVLLSLVQSS